MTARLTILLGAAMAVAALGTGCGGDDGDATASDTTVTTSSLSKAAYVKKANALCEIGRGRLVEFQPPPEGQKQPSATSEVEEKYVPGFRKIVDELRALGAPSGDEQQIEAFLEAMTEATDQIEEEPPANLTEIEKPFAHSAKLARNYGIGQCAFSV